jgi:hypothetical protein
MRKVVCIIRDFEGVVCIIAEKYMFGWSGFHSSCDTNGNAAYLFDIRKSERVTRLSLNKNTWSPKRWSEGIFSGQNVSRYWERTHATERVVRQNLRQIEAEDPDMPSSKG